MLRAAVVEDGILCEIHSERAKETKATESLFLGRVAQIKPSVCAAFVDIGLELNGFLPLDETQLKTLRCGDTVIVQGAAKQTTDTKGLRLTTKLNLAGKWLVLVPESSGVHISKKVKDEGLRRFLAETAEKICPESCGLIVRTASMDVTQELLQEEADMLYAQWLDVQRKAAGMTKPGVLRERLPLDERLVRDLAGRELCRVVTNSRQSTERFAQMQRQGLIPQTVQIEYFEEKSQLLFDAFQLEPKIERALRRHVWLDCGGYLIVDSCEAMTVIDVNSGKMTLGRDIEETALRVNLEAAQEVARQIRLRDIGGVIVVDFIDMKKAENRDALIKALRLAVRGDRAQVQVLGLTQLGLMEMTRKRVHTELRKTLCVSCSYCGGTGEIDGPEETARRALMQVRRKALSGQCGPFIVKLASAAAQALAQMTSADCEVYALPSPRSHAAHFVIEQIEEAAKLPDGAVRLKKGENQS